MTTVTARETDVYFAHFVEANAIIGAVGVSAIQQLIDDLAARLQRSVVVDDANVKLLYTSRHYGDEDEVRRRAVLQRDAGARTIGYVLSQGVATWTTAGIIPAYEELGLHTRVCVPVRWRGTLLGLLMVVDNEDTLTTGELSVITEASQELATLMIGEQPPELDEDAQALSDALDDLVASEPALRRAAIRTLTARRGDQGDRHVRVLQLNAHQGRVPAIPGHVSAVFRHAIASEGARPFAWTLLTAVREWSALILITSRTEISDEAITRYAGDLVARVHAVTWRRIVFDACGHAGPEFGGRLHAGHAQSVIGSAHPQLRRLSRGRAERGQGSRGHFGQCRGGELGAEVEVAVGVTAQQSVAYQRVRQPVGVETDMPNVRASSVAVAG